ncbi:MAG: hypothetical protein AABX77_01885 [Nanoarchaeota archaeon]
MVWRTYHDRDFKKALVDIIRKYLEKESKVIVVEVIDDVNVRRFKYENPRN